MDTPNVIDELLADLKRAFKDHKSLPVPLHKLLVAVGPNWQVKQIDKDSANKVKDCQLLHISEKASYKVWLSHILYPAYTLAYRRQDKEHTFTFTYDANYSPYKSSKPLSLLPRHSRRSIVKSEGQDFEPALKSKLLKSGYQHTEKDGNFYLYAKSKLDEIKQAIPACFYDETLLEKYPKGHYITELEVHCERCGYDGECTRKRPEFIPVCKVCNTHYTFEKGGRFIVEFTLPLGRGEVHKALNLLSKLGVQSNNVIEEMPGNILSHVCTCPIDQFRENEEKIIEIGFQSTLGEDFNKPLFADG